MSISHISSRDAAPRSVNPGRTSGFGRFMVRAIGSIAALASPGSAPAVPSSSEIHRALEPTRAMLNQYMKYGYSKNI